MTDSAQHGDSASDLGPVGFVLFGATGDPASRMVLPAWYRLACDGLLPSQWRLAGNGRGDVTHERFRAHVHDALAEFGPQAAAAGVGRLRRAGVSADGGFSAGNPGRLLEVLGGTRRALGGDPQLICYLAVPPVAFAGLTMALGQHGLAPGARVLYEKPFGTSRASFRELDWVVRSVLGEQQVYQTTGSAVSW